MTITPKTVSLALAASAVLILGFSFLSSQTRPNLPTPPNSPSKSLLEAKKSEEGNVTVVVTPKTLTPDQPPVFEVVFDTHSVNLDFDVAAVATLTDDQGNSYGTPTWAGDPPGGHHRRGTLTFPTPLPKAPTVSLILKDITGVPKRIFEWSVY